MRPRAHHATLLIGALASACNGAGRGTHTGVQGGTGSGAIDPPPAAATEPPLTVSGPLLLSASRLEALRHPAGRLRSAVRRLLDNVDQNLDAPSPDRSGVENMALAYVVSGETRYCRTALRWERRLMQDDVRRDSYLGFGDAMRQAALALDWCRPTLSADDGRALRDYLARWTEELWFANQGSGWGLSDPGNNYHYAFLEGTAYAGYGLMAAGDERGRKYVHLLLDRLERQDGVIAYLRDRLPGGGWTEGVNYGQRAKQRLFDTLSVIASTGGVNYFTRVPFFANSLRYAVFQTQPGWREQSPDGDLARDARSSVCPYDRDYVQVATFWLPDSQTRGLGQWYLTHVVPGYDGPDFDWRAGYYLDALYSLDIPVVAPTAVPPHYLEAGEGFVNARSSWDDDATSLTLAAPSIIDQSHAHFDAGSFVLYRGGWLVADAGSYSRSGLLWSSDAHSGITVAGADRRYGRRFRGLTRHQAVDGLLYAQVDATGMPVRRVGGEEHELLDEHTRELVFLMPDDVLVYDRVRPKPGEHAQWRAHFATRPEAQGDQWTVAGEKAGVSLSVLLGGPPRVASDEDLESSAFRVEVDPAQDRVLTVFRTAAGRPPVGGVTLLATDGDVTGALVGDKVVVLSTRPLGAPAGLPFSYTVPGAAERWHTILDVGERVEVVAADTPQGRRITVRAGGSEPPSQAGVVQVKR